MIKRFIYILSIYLNDGYFWILIGFISVILLSLVMMSTTQASEICNYAKQIETRNGDKIKSTITQHCWTDQPVAKKVIPLPNVLPGYNETILIRQECIGEEIVKHNIKGMEYNCD